MDFRTIEEQHVIRYAIDAMSQRLDNERKRLESNPSYPIAKYHVQTISAQMEELYAWLAQLNKEEPIKSKTKQKEGK